MVKNHEAWRDVARLAALGAEWLGGSIELEQFVEFKWRGLTVATMKFSVSIPTVEESGVSDEEKTRSFEPDVLIELVGQTKGPLRWFEDYQATVRYMQMDSQGLVNAFTLMGTDNGQPERRHIVFDSNRLPEVRLFDDSTASEALAPAGGLVGQYHQSFRGVEEDAAGSCAAGKL